MKKITLLFLLLFATANMYAQTYTISFAATGAATTVDSVTVQNITHPATVKWVAGDVLQLELSAGINSFGLNDQSLTISPNPMKGMTELAFYAKQSGKATVSIFDIAGKLILQTESNLVQGTQKYQLTGLIQGLYFISIKGDNYYYTAKLMSQNAASSIASIKYTGNDKSGDAIITNKSTRATITMPYVTGDSLVFTGFAGGFTTIVKDVPTGSKTITFNYIITTPTVITGVISNITVYTAKCNGSSVNFDGGAPVTARGVCWSTHHNPVLTDSITIDSLGTGSFSSNIRSLVQDSTYYVRAYATNSVGTAYGDEKSMTIGIVPGAFYAGGIVFYIDSTGQHGLTMAPPYLDSAPWGCSGTIIPGADGSAIGTGNQNTIDIITTCTTTITAANYCYTLTYNGYSDWYLASIDELFLAYNVLYPLGIGGFGYDVVWSSTEADSGHAWALVSTLGYTSPAYPKENSYYCKTIRNF